MKKYNHVNEEIRVDDLLDDIPSPENTMEESVSEMLNNLQERVKTHKKIESPFRGLRLTLKPQSQTLSGTDLLNPNKLISKL